MTRDRIAAAEDRARADAEDSVYCGGPRQRIGRTRRLAIGDPQAPLSRLLEILDRHRALDLDGRLRADVHLVSIGDHFDWGDRAERDTAAADGLAALAWLAAHPPDQVTLVAGNHDLARVGELVAFSDAGFAAAQAEADRIYFESATERPQIPVDVAAEERFRARFPALPSAESAARDLSTFRVGQRALVASLLRARRFVLAATVADLLLCHAGVTVDELAVLGLAPDASAAAIAGALNAALDRAVAVWDDTQPFAIPALYQPGSAADGEARGCLLHRPGDPEAPAADAALYAGPPRRRYDPHRLPPGLTQAIGHIRDNKCRQLLGAWSDVAPAEDGPLRHLSVRGGRVRYARGVSAPSGPDVATLLFLDGGMRWADASAYELLDLTTRRAAERL